MHACAAAASVYSQLWHSEGSWLLGSAAIGVLLMAVTISLGIGFASNASISLGIGFASNASLSLKFPYRTSGGPTSLFSYKPLSLSVSLKRKLGVRVLPLC